MGLTMREALSVPLSILLDLIAVQQIKLEGAERKRTEQDEQDDFFALLNFQ